MAAERNPYDFSDARYDIWERGYLAGLEDGRGERLDEIKRRYKRTKSVMTCPHGVVDTRYCTFCVDAPGG